MSSNGRIIDEEGYQRTLGWMIDKAVKLDDPLMDVAERAKEIRIYDFVEQRILEYRRGELVQMFPGLRDIYKMLGWTVQEREPITSESEPDIKPQETQVINTPPVVKSVVSQNKKPKATVNLSAWLDD